MQSTRLSSLMRLFSVVCELAKREHQSAMLRHRVILSTSSAYFHFRAFFLIVIFLVTAIQCQRRGFSHRRYQPPSFPFQPIFLPPSSFWQPRPIHDHIPQQQGEIINSNCPSVHVNRITDDGWYGVITLKSQYTTKNASVEIEFDHFVIAFVVILLLSLLLLNVPVHFRMTSLTRHHVRTKYSQSSALTRK